jgi:hypothetical protein
MQHFNPISLRTGHTTIPALLKAIQRRKHIALNGLIFHSDVGRQYYSIISGSYLQGKNMEQYGHISL